MKLSDAMVAIAKAKKQQSEPVVETVRPSTPRNNSRPLNHHRGVLHVMGLEPNSVEYEEMSLDLDELSKTNPTLYNRIINMD